VSRGRSDARGLVEVNLKVEKGRSAKHDAWYWHMIEWGTVRGIRAHYFMTQAFAISRANFVERFHGSVIREISRALGKGHRKR
jgi:hypothetical protein